MNQAKFKRALDVARFLGVDVCAVVRKHRAGTYYTIKHFGIFSKMRILEMRQYLQ